MGRLLAVLVLGLIAYAAPLRAQPVHYDEAVDGDIPFVAGVGFPLLLALAPGENTITGVLTKTPEESDMDGFGFVVAEGQQVDSIRYEYATSFHVEAGGASYNFYLDGATSPAPFEQVRVSETPSDDRTFFAEWMPLGPGQYRIGRQGSAIAGDNVYDVAYTYTIVVSDGEPEPPPVTEIVVPYQHAPPVMDGAISVNEWRTAPQIQLANGEVTLVHDLVRLYLLINMREDRSDHAFRDGGPDQLWILVDVDEDGAVTPNLDRRYRMLSATGNFRYETYAPPGGFPLNPPADRSFSGLGEGFGCFVADGSARLIPFLSCDSHRVWEVGLDLLEVHASANKSLRIGLLVQSELNVVETLPPDLSDFTRFVRLELAGETASTESIPMTPDTTLGVLDMRVTQGIQTAGNGVDLVEGRETYLSIRTSTPAGSSDTAVTTVFATRDGVDLPGSPFTQRIRERFRADADPPRQGFWNAPIGADQARGDVEFSIVARQPRLLSTTTGPAQTVSFVPTTTPTYWIVPVDSGDDTPELPRSAFLDRQELETRALFPVADIDFVRRPIRRENPATKEDAISAIQLYDQQALLAWTMGLLLTGSSPFALPDQVIGAFAETKSFGTTIGRSDPRWMDGGGRVSWIKEVTIEDGPLLAHELNHNLDLDSDGTWGRHVSGCGAGGLDPLWPYSSFPIQEPALATEPVIDRAGWSIQPPLAIASSTPDYMSYCRAVFDASTPAQRAYPYQWASPYRWQRQLQDVFAVPQLLRRTSAPAAGGQEVVLDALYLRGSVHVDGTGALEPVLRQPGVVRADQRPGEYEIRGVDCDGATLVSRSFGVSFVDVEGEPRDEVAFAMILPDVEPLCALQLRAGNLVLAERRRSLHPPEVTVVTPNGGESLAGTVTVRWHAHDADGDELTASLFYSPDDGETWLPVGGSIEGDEHEIDTATLPGSDAARLRVVVTDGMHTVRDDSDAPFRVAPKPPSVQILGPGPGTEIVAGEQQLFRGVARDPQGQTLAGDDFLWLLGGEAVGIGNPLELAFEPGAQQLALIATGEAGLEGVAVTDLVVIEAVPEPSSVALGLCGVATLWCVDRRRRAKARRG